MSTLTLKNNTTAVEYNVLLDDVAFLPLVGGRVGDATNYTEFEADGSIKFAGSATVFTDLTAAITGVKTNGPGVSLNSIEQTIDFVTAAALDDYGYLSYQLLHAWKYGSLVHPHIHWEQSASTVPNFLFQYRWQINGGQKTTAWTYLKCNTPVFTRTTGTLNQICGGASITPPVDHAISDIIQLRIIRDTTNSSTLFTGADPYGATVAISAIDIHYEIDRVGSRTEYAK